MKEHDLINVPTDGSNPQKQEAYQNWLGDLTMEEAQKRLSIDDEAHGRPYFDEVADNQLKKTFRRAREVNAEADLIYNRSNYEAHALHTRRGLRKNRP